MTDLGGALSADTVRKAYWGLAIAPLIQHVGSVEAATVALSQAIDRAASRWRADSVPDNPVQWILSQALDQPDPSTIDLLGPDYGRIPLVFLCAHPAIQSNDHPALILHLLGGWSTMEIARCFFTTEGTMARRLTDARIVLDRNGPSLRMPERVDLANRLDRVLAALDALHSVLKRARESGMPVEDLDLKVGRLVYGRLDHPEAGGLLSFLLLDASRARANITPNGRRVPLALQDRSLWDQTLITEARDILNKCLFRGMPGPFQIRAAIESAHAEAKDPVATDWGQIKELCDILIEMSDDPRAALDRIDAISQADGAEVGLDELEHCSARLDRHWRYHAVKGDLLYRTGDRVAAAEAYRRAISDCTDSAERSYLEDRLSGL